MFLYNERNITILGYAWHDRFLNYVLFFKNEQYNNVAKKTNLGCQPSAMTRSLTPEEVKFDESFFFFCFVVWFNNCLLSDTNDDANARQSSTIEEEERWYCFNIGKKKMQTCSPACGDREG